MISILTDSETKKLKKLLKGYPCNPCCNEPAYKVYSALLTQTGGSETQTIGGDGTITEGITYYIASNIFNENLTTVGAPNNNVGTSFVANQTVTGAYTGGVSLEYNTGAPVVTVLENTIGNIPWTYLTEGIYQATSPLLNDSKTLLFVQPTFNNSPNNVGYYLRFSDPDVLELTTLVEGYGPSDNWLLNTPIEIRIYN